MVIGAISANALHLINNVKSQLRPGETASYTLRAAEKQRGIHFYEMPEAGPNKLGVTISSPNDSISSLVNLKNGEVENPNRFLSTSGANLASPGKERMIQLVEETLDSLPPLVLNYTHDNLPPPPQTQ